MVVEVVVGVLSAISSGLVDDRGDGSGRSGGAGRGSGSVYGLGFRV